jgi:thioredoxin-related protein
MRQAKLFTSLLLFVALFALSAGSMENKKTKQKQLPQKETNRKEIEWLAYDIGLAKAKTEEKHVFIDFTTKWCGWCQKMDNDVFSIPEVIDMVNTNFVPVKVNGDSKNELNIDGYKITEKNLTFREFGVRGFPSYWFLKPDGTKLGVISGYKKANYMMQAFKFVKDYRYDSTRTETTDKKEKSGN